MASLTNFLLACAYALALTPTACARVEHDSASSSPPAAAAEPGELSGEEFAGLDEADAQAGEAALAAARAADGANRAPGGELPRLAPQEHMRRAAVYHANRAFDEARAHWRALISRYPADANVPAATFGIGRSLFQQRSYEEALPVFEQLGSAYPQTEAGRDGFYYVAATLLRLSRFAEAADRYAQYVARFPAGERLENAHLNALDSYREAGRFEDALAWVARTRQLYAGQPAATNALFARLRLEIARSQWQQSVATGDELLRAPFTRGVQTNVPEINYLKAYSLERAGRRDEAARVYQSVADGAGSYYGWRATTRLSNLGGAAKEAATRRDTRVGADFSAARASYPAPHRDLLLRAATQRRLDPRLMLAIMRQESGFNPRAKSFAGARGLMQLTVDAAAKYSARAGFSDLRDDDFYRPEVSIPVAAEYLAELFGMFPNLAEAVAASYNGGEDNVARWVKRATHDDPGVFAAEVGFAETKDYVAKVMANYRAYQHLYTQDLRPRR